MKFEIKKIITEVPLHCIASFVVGAYTVLLINYFWFNNNITPPGVSALIAGMALLFTIYAAFKVKEWSEQKMNDKAFGIAEEIINKINESYVEFMFASGHIIFLAGKTDNAKLFKEEPTFKKYAIHYEKHTDAHLQTLNLIDTLPIWKYHTPHRDLFATFKTKAQEFNEMFFKSYELACSSDLDRTEKFRGLYQEFKTKRLEVKQVYEELTSLTFDKIFEPTNKK
ncbi:hypothetical protein PVD82_003312 [Enterobacter hormaechei]|nr:hypothetical protein [Enterobacter hormaechei]EKM7549955.1 hypothetical protein [Enterobacter hormaechei]EKV5294892.1 hypothetical protein [Enterobacter hormaechei]EKW8461161.1 hypothetical protein [Enterobacter hormaechei]